MLRDQIKKDVEKVAGELGWLESGAGANEVKITRTNDSKFGDFSTNIALKIKRTYKQTLLEIANKLADNLSGLPYVAKLQVAGPGFINFFIKDSFWQDQVSEVLKQGKEYGSCDIGRGKKARVEFVSANPTGPLHFGNARGGPIGDSLASVLEFSGYSVLREYYLNDIGVQVGKLGESIVNIANGEKLEDQEYKGEYVFQFAKKIKESNAELAGKKAVELLSVEAIEDCKALGIVFDKVYKESEFIESAKTKEILDQLDKKGFLKKKDGALWFAPHISSGQGLALDFLQDRECVVVKTDGSYTYFANDIAYHNLKILEGYDLVIDVFGANHHGHVPRLQAAILSVGGDVRQFFAILYQWVRFKRGGELVKMSKRSGTFITAREVINEVGKDAVRFMILSHDANSHIDFDLDLAREQSNKNPVYYVQYAHARIASILRNVNPKSGIRNPNANYQLLSTNYELDLIKQITKLPELVENIAGNFAINQLTTYATELADNFHRFYENCKVIGEDKDLELARLGLAEATKITLNNTLNLLGVSAPEKM